MFQKQVEDASVILSALLPSRRDIQLRLYAQNPSSQIKNNLALTDTKVSQCTESCNATAYMHSHSSIHLLHPLPIGRYS